MYDYHNLVLFCHLIFYQIFIQLIFVYSQTKFHKDLTYIEGLYSSMK